MKKTSAVINRISLIILLVAGILIGCRASGLIMA